MQTHRAGKNDEKLIKAWDYTESNESFTSD